MDKISIIIPARNEEQYLERCLSSIEEIDYPQDHIEVIVVDNGSTDRTVEIAKSHQAKVFIRGDGCNVSQLRNFGAKMAKNKILAFVDADCSVPSRWIWDALKFLQLSKVGAVGCWYKLPEQRTTWVESVWDIQMMGRRNLIGEVNWVPSGNFVVSKDIFFQIEGFDESLVTSEDVDICSRIIKEGYSVYSHPKLAIEHLGEPNSVFKYFKKESWRGQGVFQNFLRHLPHLKLNKALLLAFLTLSLCAGVIFGLTVGLTIGNTQILGMSTLLLISVPLILSIKTLMGKKQSLRYLVPLAFLFFLYSVARASSLCDPKVWTILPKS
jgi:glycosyltransferase involved in cell wall biosynthesis